LSVSLITYNQKQYIKQAIEGVLQQKTNFIRELVIGDDCSTDGTRDILVSYQKKYSEQIRLILHPKRNEGIPGKVNFLSTINAATGKYIALLDGDDYWCDPGKLQKQVDFLEANPGYAICCHRIYIKKDNQKPKLYADEYMPSAEATYDIEMMAKFGNLVAAPSVVYRSQLFSSLPAWFDQSPIGDYVLHMMNAQYGKIKYFPEPMAVYREHSKGAWSGQSVLTNASNMIKVIELLLTEPFNELVKKGLKEQLQKYRAIYLNEVMKEDRDRFNKELDIIAGNDKAGVLSLIEKMKMDTSRRSPAYRVLQKLKKIFILF
jgi:glycosyltransferase involved in cell wall biosynthesis